MDSIRCFTCGRPVPMRGVTMEKLFEMVMPVFCCSDCADAYPYQGMPDFTRRFEDSRRQLLDVGAPLQGKLIVDVAGLGRGPWCAASDVCAAVCWLKREIARAGGDTDALRSAVDAAFVDVAPERP